MTPRRFDQRGGLTRAGQRYYAVRHIRRKLRDYAQARRLGRTDHFAIIEKATTAAAIHLARGCELIAEERADALTRRLKRIEKARITRAPTRYLKAVTA